MRRQASAQSLPPIECCLFPGFGMEKAIQQVTSFIEGDDNEEYFFFQEDREPKAGDTEFHLSINGEHEFSMAFPSLQVTSHVDKLAEWCTRVNAFSEKNKDVGAVLRHATKVYRDLGLADQGDDDDDAGVVDHFDEPAQPVQRRSAAELQQDKEFEDFVDKYKHRGLTANVQASSRIFQDLRQLWRAGRNFGFWADPHPDNLFKWTVTFFNFEKDTPLFKDMIEYKKRSGKDFVEFAMEFPPDYPFRPPFIRAVRPRFQFHTAHITIGGSICMELLTTSGWTAANSIESVLICIRTELTAGGGRLDLANAQDYSEAEARDAFQRVARQHGWEK
eukprot:TRINITY_DN17960_c0_g1_i1.p1 TRINITY_DN17960_c0_g1~~TRINITY_DN17960_c0_g1_i1.p1  ORF type:complete len:333 (-),score=58.23 TRINITY_DN17960_c0_g1_i1:46-1044(-)